MKPTFDRLRQFTDPDGKRDSVASSYEGMAHFAGTGPEGATCRHCQHWHMGKPRTFGNMVKAPEPERAVCAQFAAMVKIKPKPFPGDALACKWFEPFVERRLRQGL